jgi:tubulin polyglutamylase TTLL5
MQEKFGKDYFNIMPDTYVLPDEFADFYSHFHRLKKQISQHDQYKKNLWILKPSSSSRGRGIYLIDDISEVPIDEHCVVSKYVTNPLLINGHKFDLRIYVLITSFSPLRIYVYREGLARFASEPFTINHSKSNRFVHLTNYSVNKKNDKYIQNETIENDDFGNKWSLSGLCKHLESIGIDMNLLWSRIYDVIIKSILSAENSITS